MKVNKWFLDTSDTQNGSVECVCTSFETNCLAFVISFHFDNQYFTFLEE